VRLRVPAVDRSEPGDLLARVTADTTLLREVTTGSLVSAVTSTLMLLATVTMMALLDPLLLMVTVAVLGSAQAVIGVVVPRISRAASRAQESVGAMGTALERMLGAMRTVKASGAERREALRVEEAAAHAWQAGVRAAKWEALAGNTAGLAVQVSFIVVLGLGGARVASGAIDVGTLIAFLLYLYYLLPPMRELVGAASQYQVGAAAVARIRQAERLPVEPDSAPAELSGPDAEPAAVAFEQVHFRYRSELPEAHRGLSFTVPPRGMTAFVGPSGAGKTTVFSLIERFYQPDAGQVLVDGTDVADWPLADLRAAIGYVEQDARCCPAPCARTWCWAPRRPVTTSWPRCCAPPGSTARSHACPTGWTPWSATAAPDCRAANASASRSPAPCCATPACCCWTRPPPSSTPSTRRPCATPSPRRPAPPPCWSSPTGCPR
jgi:ATP-binding cassette subfamily C protein